MRQLFALILLLIGSSCVAQNIETFLGTQAAINNEDIQVGLRYEWHLKSKPYYFKLSYDRRPFQRKVWKLMDVNLYHQYAERRHYVGPGVGLKIPLTKTMSWVGEVDAFYSWARYGGLNLRPKDGYAISPGSGFRFRNVLRKDDALMIGFKYRETLAPLERFYFHIGYSIDISNK